MAFAAGDWIQFSCLIDRLLSIENTLYFMSLHDVIKVSERCSLSDLAGRFPYHDKKSQENISNDAKGPIAPAGHAVHSGLERAMCTAQVYKPSTETATVATDWDQDVLLRIRNEQCKNL